MYISNCKEKKKINKPGQIAALLKLLGNEYKGHAILCSEV